MVSFSYDPDSSLIVGVYVQEKSSGTGTGTESGVGTSTESGVGTSTESGADTGSESSAVPGEAPDVGSAAVSSAESEAGTQNQTDNAETEVFLWGEDTDNPQNEPEENQEEETCYVWVITAMQLERKEITVLYHGDGYCLVERETRPDALREGNTVVVSGENLYEGKVMG